jgi:hypothetical protein
MDLCKKKINREVTRGNKKKKKITWVVCLKQGSYTWISRGKKVLKSFKSKWKKINQKDIKYLEWISLDFNW